MFISVSTVKEAILESIFSGWGFDRSQVEELTKPPMGKVAFDVRIAIEGLLVSNIFAIEPIDHTPDLKAQ